MIVLRTLGECAIDVGPQRIGPSAPHLFGALLYLGVERGRTVPRATLQALLFPDADETRGAHSLRQLVYKLRNHGAPVATGSDGVSLPAECVRDDYSAFLAPAGSDRCDVQRAGGTFLPGYLPRWSEPFAHWVEAQRDQMHARIRRTLLTELAEHRQAGRWEQAERTARACLALDPLNEEATLALAEALAVAGSKVKAVRLLDDYIAELGAGAAAMKLPATLLRRRIAERLPSVEYDASQSAFVGRGEELAELNALFTEARRGMNRAVVVWGEAGIGKTRLVAEFCKAAALGGATVLRAVSQPHDVRRPMGAFLDVAPQLLGLPGALGTSPEAMRYLQRLVAFDPQLDQPMTAEMRDPEYLAACITRALSELLDAVSAEAPLILVMEDAQWLDRVSTMVLGDLLSERRERRLLLVSTWRAAEDPMPELPFPERARSIRLTGLAAADATRLLEGQFRDLAVPTNAELLAWGVSTAQGNPFFLHELARHYAVHREVGAVPVSLTSLLAERLRSTGADAMKCLTASAALGKLSSPRRVEAVLALERDRLASALTTLERHGLVVLDQAGLRIAHPLIAELASRSVTPAVRNLLHAHIAEQLTTEIEEGAHTLVIPCAYHWLQAELPAKALTLIRRASRQLASIGQAAGALALLQDVAKTQPPAHLLVQLGGELLDLAEACDEWPEAAHLCGFIRSALDATDSEATQMLRLRELRARWRCSDDPEKLSDELDSLIPTLKSAALLCEAAFIQIPLAEFLLMPDRAHATFAAIVDFLNDPSVPLTGLHAALMYHATFGDGTCVRALADRLSALGATSPSLSARLRHARNIAVALFRTGHVDDSIVLLNTNLREAQALGLDFQVWQHAIQLATFDLYLGHIPSAESWLALARRHADGVERPAQRGEYRLAECLLHLARHQHAEAHAILQQFKANNPTASKGLGRLLQLAFTIDIAIQESGEAPVAETDELHRFINPALGMISCDFVVAALAIALSSRGSITDAQAVVRLHMRGRSPHAPVQYRLRALL